MLDGDKKKYGNYIKLLDYSK